MKQLLLSLILMFPSLQLLADEINAIDMHLSTGNQGTFLLADEPLVNFADNNIVINSNMGNVTSEETEGTLIRNVTIYEAGTLATILSDDLYKVTHLSIEGSINGEDFNTLRLMMGCGENPWSRGSNQNLVYLNLQNVRIVKGGNYAGDFLLDENDILPKYVFRCSQSLQKIILPKSLKRIELEALYLSSSLEEIILNEGIEEIGPSSIGDNGIDSKLRTLYIPSTVNYLDPTFLQGCYKLTNLTISDNNPYYVMSNNAIYTHSKKELICTVPSYKGILVLDNNCESTASHAFAFNSNLKGVIAENVREVKNFSFWWNQDLEFVAFGAALRKFDNNFYNCDNLNSIYLGCTNAPEGAYETSEYYDPIIHTTLYVPRESINKYRKHSYWMHAKSIEAIEDTEYAYFAYDIENENKILNSLVLHLHNGQKMSYLLEEEPVITFDDCDIVVTADKNIIRFLASDIIKFTYSNNISDNIDEVATTKTQVRLSGNILTINGLVPNSSIKIYSLNGILVASSVADLNGNVKLELPNVSKQVYVVNNSIESFKIVKP